MKKKLLLMLMLVLVTMPAFSDVVDVDIKSLFGNRTSNLNFGTTPTKKEHGDIQFVFTKNGTNVFGYDPRTFKPLAGINMMGEGNTMAVSGKTGTSIKISKVVLNLFSTNEATAVKVNDVEYPVSGSTFTWEGAPSATVTFADPTGKLKFTSLQVTYSGISNSTPMPVITPENGTYYNSLEVTIAPGEGSPEGTRIYYVTEAYSIIGNVPDPTEESTEYTGPIVLNYGERNQVVKAIAVAPGMDPSGMVFRDYSIKSATPCSSIYQFILNASDNQNMFYMMEKECTVLYQNGPVMFVTDGDNTLYIANVPAGKYKEGDVISGFYGKYTDFRSKAGMLANPDSFKDAVRNEPYVWNNGTYTDLTNTSLYSNCSPYAVNTVWFQRNMEAEDSSVNGWLIFANGDKVALYNALTQSSLETPVEFPAMEGWYDVKGVTSIYETVESGSQADLTLYQFIPFSFVESVADKTAVPVFTPAAGKYQLPLEVTVTCETPDAVIRYTEDGSDPTMDSPIMNGSVTINKATSFKAFAVAQGLLPSDKAESFYEFKVTGIEGIDAEDCEAEYFDLLGRRVSKPANGMYIMRRNGESTPVLVK